MAARIYQLLSDIEHSNFEGISFYSEKEFLEQFDDNLLDKVLEQISPDQEGLSFSHSIAQSSYRQTIFDNYRICLGVLASIGRQRYIFRFCEDRRMRDDHLPTTMDVLATLNVDAEDTKFAAKFYQKQFAFKPYTLTRSSSNTQTLQILTDETVIPILKMTRLGEGGWSVVYKMEIHPDYDHLQNTGSHVYACKQLLDEGADMIDDDDNGDEGYLSFKQEVAIQHSLQGASQHILPVLTSYKHRNTYRMILPIADHSLQSHFHTSIPPDNPEAQLAFMQKTANIVSAVRAIHEYQTEENTENCTDNSNRPKVITTHRDISPQNILIKGDHMFLADFGQAIVKTVDSGDYSGSPWIWGPSTYLAPECAKTDAVVGRGGDVWSLGCVISEILTFILLGNDGIQEFRQSRSIDNRDSFHHNGCLKQEVLGWFVKLREQSRYSKVVVEILALLQDMLHEDPTKRPNMAMVEIRFSYAMIDWENQILSHGSWTLISEPDEMEKELDQQVLEQPKPRTSESQPAYFSKLSIPFTSLNMVFSFLLKN